MRKTATTVLFALASLAPALACAHPQHAGATFMSGFSHPLLGIDHLLAMIMVGICAVSVSGRALWVLPSTFLGGMAAGGLIGGAGITVPLVEPLVAATVLVLGLIVVLEARARLPLSAALVACFALLHGAAHAAEIRASEALIAYCAGFICATALLHISGIAAGHVLRRRPSALRLAVTPVALTGAWLLLARLS